METGKTTILYNLEKIYPSLYDLFNQNFIEIGGFKHCYITMYYEKP